MILVNFFRLNFSFIWWVILSIFIILLVFLYCNTLSLGQLVVYPDFLWNPIKGQFSMIPFICGTMLVAVFTMLVSIPFAISLGILSWFIQNQKGKKKLLDFFLNFANGIPPVVWGMLGLFFLSPCVWAAVVLCSLISIPFLAICIRDTLSLKSGGQYLQQIQENSYALGADHFETFCYVIFPHKKNNIISIFLLGLGRSLGEATAVSMIIGSRNFIPRGIFSPGQTITGLITTEFTETLSDMHFCGLMILAFILFMITTFVNIVGELVFEKTK